MEYGNNKTKDKISNERELGGGKTAGKTYVYQLIDFYTLFYLHFGLEKDNCDRNVWMHLQTSPKYTNWLGLSFERLCFAHVYQIQQVLGISGIATKTYAYHGSDTQMDMVIERADGIVNLCEMKYTGSAYNLTKSEADKIQNRIDQLVNLIRPKGINVVLITSKSAQHNDYYNQLINNNITINDLFVL